MKLSRRRAMQVAAGGAALALTEGLGLGRPASAWASPGGGAVRRPTNLVLVYHPNGLEEGWRPTVEDGVLKLSPTLQALTPFASRMVVVHGLHAGIRNEVQAHSEGMTSMWTGAQIAKSDAYAAHPSLDQLLAPSLSTGTPFRSLELGVQSQSGFGAGGNGGVMIYSAGGPLTPEDDPNAVYRRLFAGAMGGDPQAVARARARRKSVLDFVLGRLAAVKAAVPRSEQAKLEAHLGAVREMEQRLDGLTAMSCDARYTEHRLGSFALGLTENFPALAALQQELLVLALSCGLTRVASLQYTNSVSDRRIPAVNPNVGIHALMHTGAISERVAVNRYFAGQVASLLARLDAVAVGQGRTLLDETLVVWGTEMAIGNHLKDPVPFFVFGGDRQLGPLRTGRLVEVTDGSRTMRLLCAVASACGVSGITQLGDLRDENSRGVLPGVLKEG